jgi:hypothetical protein
MKNKLFCLILIFFVNQIHGYGLPPLSLGFSSFLDGGPLRLRPGWYWQQYNQYLHFDRFLDANGCDLANQRISLDDIATITQGVYQTDHKILGGNLGFDAALSLDLYLHVGHNNLGIKSSGSGFGSLYLGMFLQREPISISNKFTYVDRFEMNVILPIGKNKEPIKNVNPAAAFAYINPYWAATLYVTEKWAFSWRISYLWLATNYKSCVKPGDAIFMHYTTEYWALKNLWIGINGYFLHQLKNDKLRGITVPNSKEKVIGIGPGFLWYIFGNIDFVLFGNLYFETHARNRPQGINLIVRLFKYFGDS